MPLTMNDLTVSFSHLDQASILGDWRWLIGPNRLPILISAAGDAFLEDAIDGTVWFLDVGSSECSQVSASVEEFRQKLTDAEFVTDHFVPAMIGDLLAEERQLADGQVYSLKKPVGLGGKYTLDNIEACDIEVHFSTTGQLGEKIRQLHPETKIDEVSSS